MTNETVEKLIERFDFEACEKYMRDAGWRWNETAPSKDDMREMVRYLARRILQPDLAQTDGEAAASCGGFVVTRHADLTWSVRFQATCHRPRADRSKPPTTIAESSERSP